MAGHAGPVLRFLCPYPWGASYRRLGRAFHRPRAAALIARLRPGCDPWRVVVTADLGGTRGRPLVLRLRPRRNLDLPGFPIRAVGRVAPRRRTITGTRGRWWLGRTGIVAVVRRTRVVMRPVIRIAGAVMTVVRIAAVITAATVAAVDAYSTRIWVAAIAVGAVVLRGGATMVIAARPGAAADVVVSDATAQCGGSKKRGDD
jgi:hypothetical protein